MTSPIYLGNFQMAEHGLGRGAYTTNGGFAGTYSAGSQVGLLSPSITIRNPLGAAIAVTYTVSCYTSQVGTIVQGFANVDNTGFLNLGSVFYFNQASSHTQTTWHGILGTVNYYAAGAHLVTLGLYVAAGNITFDSNDGGNCHILEVT